MTDVKKLITEHLDIWLTAETEKKSGRERISGSSNSIYGVQKLRELILDLAISGQLIHHTTIQAQELLDQILVNRTNLIDKGLLKKQKELIPISELEIPFSIPTHWCWTQLGRITNYGISERDFIISDSTWVLDLEDIEKDTSKILKKVIYSQRASLSEKNAFKAGDILYGKLRPYLNKVIIAEEEGVCSSEIMAFRTYAKTEPHFLKYVLKSSYFLKYVNSKSYGMKMPRLGTEDARNALIPLPPLEEQQRIVAKVDELMQLCDQLEQKQNLSSEAHDQLVDTLLSVLTNSSDVDEFKKHWQQISENFDLLFTTEYSIEQLKQTILQLAVMGKLVKPEAMDETTKLEIHQHKINFSKKNSEANFVNFHGLNELKNGFSKNMEIFRLGDIADIVRGGSPRPAGDLRFYEGNIPFLKVADITRSKGKFVEGHTSTIKEAGLHKTRFIDSRTVLLTNSGATLGVPAICDFPTTFNDGVAAFINLSNHVFDEYLYLYLSTLTKWFLNVAAQGQGQPNLNTEIVKSTWIALPTRKVQKDIVDMVDNLFSIIDRLQTLQSKMRKTQHHLADSFVANALLDSTDRHEAETEDNIIQFEKPIETIKHSKQKSTDQIDLFTYENVDDDLKLLSLAAEITFQLHTEPTFGHLKLQKLVYLCQQLKHMDLAADFKQHAAGPYDPVMARYLDKEFKNREWFSYDPKRDLKYKPLSRCNDHRSAFNRYFAEDVSEIYDLIGLFRTSKSDHIEIVATLFACWLRLLEKKLSVTEEQLLKDFYAWSEEKKRFSKAEVLTGYKWMHQYSIIPQV